MVWKVAKEGSGRGEGVVVVVMEGLWKVLLGGKLASTAVLDLMR